ncbi:MAG: hypothetical protein AAGK37_20795 [Pseudomonadota bacterium]
MPISHYPEHVVAYNAEVALRLLNWSAFRDFLTGERRGRHVPAPRTDTD